MLLLRFPLILPQKTESSIDGILLKKGIIDLSVVLLFRLYHLVRFSLALSPSIWIAITFLIFFSSHSLNVLVSLKLFSHYDVYFFGRSGRTDHDVLNTVFTLVYGRLQTASPLKRRGVGSN